MNSNDIASQPWLVKKVPHPGEPPSAVSALADKTRYAARLDAHLAFLMSKTALDSFERTTLAKAIVEALKQSGHI